MTTEAGTWLEKNSLPVKEESMHGKRWSCYMAMLLFLTAGWHVVGTGKAVAADSIPITGETSPLSVTIGKTIQIIPGAHYRSLFQYRNGELAVSGYHSTDGGKTWHKGPALNTGYIERRNGEILGLAFQTHRLSKGVFETTLNRSTDGGKTFSATKVKLFIPDAVGGTGDNGKHFEGPVCDHAIVECRDGSLLAAMYGYFKNDKVLCPTMPASWKMYKYRTFVVRSTDNGQTWRYLSTCAYNPDIGLESFCEADLLSLPGGDILCFMRTGGSGGKHTPLYSCVSHDDGKTWQGLHPVADRGVWPNACRMRNGIIALTYGRPDNWLQFSLDNGKTWTRPVCFYRGQTSSYNSLAEVSPGKLLVVYDCKQPSAETGKAEWSVVGTFISVKKR